MMNFGENLQTLRKQKNYSQEDLADRLQVSRQAVSKWESGTGYPEIEKLISICDLFDCSMDELIKGKISIDSNSEKEIYDSFMNKFSKSISLAIMLILIGTTLLLTILGFNKDNNMYGIVVLLIFVVFSVPIFIIKGMEMDNFKSKYPKLSNFYSQEEIDKYNNKFSKIV
ncbi:MAG: helix-turn-helix domain-containing protein, partial [Bacilli bacterium]|nr:helix-turn-helix domain-containing protein [Bacilli bacterium]